VTAPAIELRSVHRAFAVADPDAPLVAETHALAGVDLVVQRGELVALTGPSGSGKSTLLHLAGALDSPSGGTVAVAGTDLATLDATARARLRGTTIGFVFQAFHLSPGLTIAENIALPAMIARLPKREVATRVARLLDLVDLGSKAARRPAQLSGGEQQRAAVARALVMDPAIVLADEPTGNLDSVAGGLVIELLLAAHHAGRTVVIATHEHRLAARAERVIQLRDGQIVHEVRPSRRDRDLDELLDLAP
jgi:putative ABC transport system ATP-binding protein